MKNKYVAISGFSFSEEEDMAKLSNYAKSGWILEDIVGVFFYKLRKDKPQDIIYSLDYQSDVDDEYFNIFKEAGWQLVISVDKGTHIFVAQAGTKPIYSDRKSEIDKYINIRNQTKKGTIYSSIIGIILLSLLALSVIFIKPIFLIILALLIIDIIIFVFSYMPYLAYNSRIKQIQRNEMCKSGEIDNKISYKVDAFIGSIFLADGIFFLIKKNYFSIVFIILAVFSIILSIVHYKRYRKYCH